MAEYKFPENFIFGAATSAYQIEGAVREDGRGRCSWDDVKPADFKGDVGDIACDHYHRYKEDIALMKQLGLKSYRFSISWVRIFPNGYGEINPKGIEFYNNLINECIKNQIVPVATIWHGDLPLEFEKNGSWANREVIPHYLEYAKFLFNTFGDRIKTWFTHNEPWCAAFLGDEEFSIKLQKAHHLLVAHALAVKAYRESKYNDGKIGIVLNLGRQYPATFDPKDVYAARNIDGFINRWFLDPVFKGEYPVDMLELYLKNNYKFTILDGDMELLKENKMDFLGINMYSRGIQKYNPNDTLFFCQGVENKEAVYTDMGWEVCPESLYDLLMDLKYAYNNPEIHITENGAAFKDELIDDGLVIDDDRLNYYKGHLINLHKAISHGCHVVSYYAWSLMDNFEWGLGYSKRFGIIRVNYETLERSIKKSGLFYRDVIKNNGIIE